MRHHTFRNIIFLLTLLLTNHIQAQRTVVARLDTAQILIGRQVLLHLDVTAEKGEKVAFPAYQPTQQMVPGVEVIRTGAVDTLTSENSGMQKLSCAYTITSFDSADYRLQPAVMVGGDSIRPVTAALLKVNTVAVDTTNYDKFYGPHGTVDEPFTWSARFLWPALLLLLLAIAIVILLTKLSDRKPRTRRVVIPPKASPHKTAMAAMGNIKTLPHHDKETKKAYYMQLTDALRDYILDRFHINAKEMTSHEIVEALQQHGDAAALAELRDIFGTADLVKFAGHETSLSEADRNMLQAIDFVNSTRPDETAEPKPEVKIVTVGEVRQRSIRRRMMWALAVLCLAAAALLAWLIYFLFVYFI